jgi:hypothetical protein
MGEWSVWPFRAISAHDRFFSEAFPAGCQEKENIARCKKIMNENKILFMCKKEGGAVSPVFRAGHFANGLFLTIFFLNFCLHRFQKMRMKLLIHEVVYERKLFT